MQSAESTMAILKALDETYGELAPFLAHRNPFELLVAVILSAQTTDLLINKITPALFERFPDAESMKLASVEEIEACIRSVNYYKTKARHLKETARMISEEFGDAIPATIEELVTLPGVGRKVANVIVAEIHKVPLGIVVDTHVKRVAYRIGWTQSKNPTVIERDMMNFIPKEFYLNLPKQLILVGRNLCFPKEPDCSNCPVRFWCEKNL